MSAAEGSGGDRWLSRLSRGKKHRQSALSSSGHVGLGSDSLASKKASDETWERATTQDPAGAGVTSAATRSREPTTLASFTEVAAVPAVERGPRLTFAPSSPPGGESSLSGPESATSSLIAGQSQPANAREALAALVAELGDGAKYTHVFVPNFAPFSVPKGMEHALITDESGFTTLRIAKGEENAHSFGNTEGYSVRLPNEIERLASGRTIKLRLLARSMDGAEGRIAGAYSTNEVGNSGWRWLTFKPEWEIQSFEYNVPPMQNGYGDFVGLLPPPESAPVTEILGFAIEIAP